MIVLVIIFVEYRHPSIHLDDVHSNLLDGLLPSANSMG